MICHSVFWTFARKLDLCDVFIIIIIYYYFFTFCLYLLYELMIIIIMSTKNYFMFSGNLSLLDFYTAASLSQGMANNKRR